MRLDKLHFLLALATLLAVALPAGLWTRASATRLTESLGKASEVATASVSNQGYWRLRKMVSGTWQAILASTYSDAIATGDHWKSGASVQIHFGGSTGSLVSTVTVDGGVAFGRAGFEGGSWKE